MNLAFRTIEPKYKITFPEKSAVIDFPVRTETKTFSEMEAEIDSRFYEFVLNNKWSLDLGESLFGQMLDLKNQMLFHIDTFFDQLEITALLRKFPKNNVEKL
jgi:hypothetical protein